MTRRPRNPLSISSLTAPVAMGYIPLGAVFGFLFVQAGGSGWLALASSLLIYAGAAQFMMVPMLAASLPVSAIVLATLVLNLRHVFYGLSLLSSMPVNRWQRLYGIFALTDESYSVLTALPAHERPHRMALVCALNQAWWVLGTALGVVLGARAQIGLTGLDFVLAALFAVLAVAQWRTRRDVIPIWIALASYGIALVALPSQALAIAIGLSLVASFVRPARTTGGRT
ncbi:MAG: branched-chain amino acid ABC transporter permease [Castellaniella sp.]|uniref:AzlC family ABC transporter permease n=1 Tax=Castellaniella sp. TaxID=1955812 RepID=UPI00122B82B8|nr:AzlC family ABC transporter permease [Castellaniella sp.]TAN31126.1 MAG: branched-chain amino acid ABC transporter permease [Castellaniella sp.]